MRRPAIRRFPHEVIRRRAGPELRNDFGEVERGVIVRTILPALIQPASLEDVNLEGGVQLSERLRVYIPTGIERRITATEPVTYRGRNVLLRGEPVTFGGRAGLVSGDANPLAAAFDDRGGDEVEIGAIIYVVEESQLWAGSHCRAILFRET